MILICISSFFLTGSEYSYSFSHPSATPLSSLHLSHPPAPGGEGPIHSPLNSPHPLSSPTCLTSPASSHMSTDSSLMGLQPHELHVKSPTHTVVAPDPSLLPPNYGTIPSPTLQPPPLLPSSVPYVQDQSYAHAHSLSHQHTVHDHLMTGNQELPTAVQPHPPVLSHPMVTAE